MLRPSAEQLAIAARAEAIFSPSPVSAPPLTDFQLEKKAFDDNRLRLKQERLAREGVRTGLTTTDKSGR